MLYRACEALTLEDFLCEVTEDSATSWGAEGSFCESCSDELKASSGCGGWFFESAWGLFDSCF